MGKAKPLFPFRNDVKPVRGRAKKKKKKVVSLQCSITSQAMPIRNSPTISSPRPEAVRVVPQRTSTGILKQLVGAGVEFGFPNIKSFRQKKKKHYVYKQPALDSQVVANQAVLDIRPASATVRPRNYLSSPMG